MSFLLVSGFDLATKTYESGDQRALMIKMALLFMRLRQGLRRLFSQYKSQHFACFLPLFVVYY
ncbi:hypothetical protein QQ41_06470 [Streptococcus equi subsp. zooepidemicus]|nr:hypothetical protein QQ41_06470 [Streptococcus equi subsp. zooepidemicus]